MSILLSRGTGMQTQEVRDADMRIFIVFLISPFVFLIFLGIKAHAISDEQRRLILSGIYYYDMEETPQFRSCFSGDDLDRFLQAIAHLESGGDSTAENPNSTASGKYQYIDRTWQSVRNLYPPAQQYDRAKNAPEEMQDAVAYIEYAQKFSQYNGDIFNLAVSHFAPAALDDSNDIGLDSVIPPNDHTVRDYADRIVEHVEQGTGSYILLHYANAPDFEEHLDEAVDDRTIFTNSWQNCYISGNWVWPYEPGGIITSCFGPRNGRNHNGIDITAAVGAEEKVLAAASGTVRFSGIDPVTRAQSDEGAGNMIIINHGDGTETHYFHLKDNSLLVQEGDTVSAGQHIATEGTTGSSTGTHLHFEIWRNSQPVDPLSEMAKPDGVFATSESNC